MIFIRIWTVFLLFISSSLAFADDLDISFNNDSLAFMYDTSMASLIHGNSHLRLGIDYNANSLNSLIDEGILVKADEGDVQGATLALGAKGLVGSIKNYVPGVPQNVSGIVLGGELEYIFPTAKQLSTSLHYFAGPPILTFGNANRINQLGMNLYFEVSPGTKIYAEYHETNFVITSTGQNALLDGGLFMGAKLRF